MTLNTCLYWRVHIGLLLVRYLFWGELNPLWLNFKPICFTLSVVRCDSFDRIPQFLVGNKRVSPCVGFSLEPLQHGQPTQSLVIRIFESVVIPRSCHVTSSKFTKTPAYTSREIDKIYLYRVSPCKILHVPVECGLIKYCSLRDKDIILCYLGAKFCCLWQRTPTSLVKVQWCTQVHVIQFFFHHMLMQLKQFV